MNRRTFVFRTSGLVLTAWVAPTLAQVPSQKKMDRIAMGTLLFRYRFKQTKPKELATIKNELTLQDIPEHHRDRFGVSKLEFWSEHFESLDESYLAKIRAKIKTAKCQLLDVQLDSSPVTKPYDLASTNEEERQAGLKTVRNWMDAASFLGSTCVRVNPGKPKGSVEKSVESLKELTVYAKSKNLVIITANHFGLEMNPDVHVRVVKEAGPGIYTEPDFGNYPSDAALYSKLEKIIPYAYVVSAKVVDFNDQIEHVSYDFDKCVQLAERLGFKGTYMVAQWSGKFMDIDYEKVGDWVIDHIKKNIA
ncbi:MAG: Xylose isomerase-like barrel [Verrucomicrobiales bacterium]|nr:Xylose isomerase-like barrel [Verrucomicrobiales bacterium]